MDRWANEAHETDSVDLDSPENVQVQVRGKQVHVRTSGPAVRIVTATGWHRP